MATRFFSTTPRNVARIAGLGYLGIIVFGIFAEFVVRSSLIEDGDAAKTAQNIATFQGLFRFGIASDLVMIVLDVMVAAALYVLFRPVSAGLAMFAAWLRLIQAAVLGALLLTLVFVLQLASGADNLTAIDAGQRDALILLFSEAHGFGYSIGLVFFGAHLLVLSYLVFRSGFLPKVLGALLLSAGVGYLVDSFANIVLTNYDDFETLFATVVFMPAFIGEMALALWLLVKGVKVEEPPIQAPAKELSAW